MKKALLLFFTLSILMIIFGCSKENKTSSESVSTSENDNSTANNSDSTVANKTGSSGKKIIAEQYRGLFLLKDSDPDYYINGYEVGETYLISLNGGGAFDEIEKVEFKPEPWTEGNQLMQNSGALGYFPNENMLIMYNRGEEVFVRSNLRLKDQ